MRLLRLYLLLIVGFLASNSVHAQIIKDPTTWTYEVKKKAMNEYELVFHLSLKENWHVWSIKPGGDGFQIVPSFVLDKNTALKSQSKIREIGKPVTKKVEGVKGLVTSLANHVDYVMTVKVTGNTLLKGKQEYQVCNENVCLPPMNKDFAFELK
jgi:thiol:disulfide interchange protein DsbD